MKPKTVWLVIWSTIAIITSVLFLVVPFYAPRVEKEAYRQLVPQTERFLPGPGLSSSPSLTPATDSSTFTSGK